MMEGGKAAMVVPEDVKKEIENFLKDRFDFPEDFVPGGEEDEFFGLRGLLHPRELTYLAYLLEQYYGIRFSMEEYDDPRFYSISGLSEIVAEVAKEQCQQK